MIFIPLGEECYCCQSIDGKISNNHIRQHGFPFDYVAGTAVQVIYNNLYNLLINNEGPLNEKDFNTNYFCSISNKYYFTNNKYGFIYWHDVGSVDGNFTEEETNQFISKYNRRYERLVNTIKLCDSITFLSVGHFDNVYNKIYKKDEILQLYNFLYSINNNIKFIAINYTSENIIDNNLQFVNLNVNTEIPIPESKLQFTETLYAFISKLNLLEPNL